MAGLPTIGEAISRAADAFERAGLALGHGTATYDDEATFLILETLNLPQGDLDAVIGRKITSSEAAAIKKVIDTRIATRIPAPYIVNKAYIQGIPFFVDRRVIVPRSFIAELLLGDGLLGSPAFIPEPDAVTRVLDLCTGSGCLAIVAAMLFPNARIDAVDLSSDALEVAKINLTQHDLSDRIALYHGDLFAPLGNACYDLILTNPPYVDADAMAALPDEYRAEPELALAGGNDGLDIVRRIVDRARQYLSPDGALLCEIGSGREALERSYPDLNVMWLDTAGSEGEVFWTAARDLPA
ncbi:MAG: 50S ribosomal protein L3 N(5)-glutamine methyltransferase [Rhodobacteraceae bacterium]|nr:50S ribosomal protein L3 N(5)-glutamine methyltransferase [Paracoccaceae bacterium]